MTSLFYSSRREHVLQYLCFVTQRSFNVQKTEQITGSFFLSGFRSDFQHYFHQQIILDFCQEKKHSVDEKQEAGVSVDKWTFARPEIPTLRHFGLQWAYLHHSI